MEKIYWSQYVRSDEFGNYAAISCGKLLVIRRQYKEQQAEIEELKAKLEMVMDYIEWINQEESSIGDFYRMSDQELTKLGLKK